MIVHAYYILIFGTVEQHLGYICATHGINSNSGIAYLKIIGIGNGIFGIGIEVCSKKIHKLIDLSFFNSKIFLPRQSYLEYKLLRVDIPSRYS